MALKIVTEMGTLTVIGEVELAQSFHRKAGKGDLAITVKLAIPETPADDIAAWTATARQVMDFFNYLGLDSTPFIMTIGDDKEEEQS